MNRTVPLLLISTFALSACSLLSTTEPSTSASTSAAPVEDVAIVTAVPEDPFSSPVYQQSLTWETCGVLECSTVKVPLDWSVPDGPTIDIAINRRPADAPATKVGSLLLNPGGPGGSGLELLEYFEDGAGEDLLASYDLIGFDPRGVGQSTPIDCGDGRNLDAYYIPDFVIEDQDSLEQAGARNRDLAADCRELTGALIGNVDTVSVARDMDVLRAVLGDEKLNYLGFSYGTQLGATYAEIYPANVGRMVLDGAVDFVLPGEEQSIVQAQGFENALTNFINWCLERDTCPLTGPTDNARQQIGAVAKDALDRPYAGGGLTPINGNLMVYGIVVTLYDEASWEYLELALTETINEGTAEVFSELANFYLDRDSQTGEYLTNSTPVFTAINCLDAEPGEWTIQDQLDFAEAVEQASPTFGWWFSSGAGCEGWPYTAEMHITSLDNAKTAAPMLVVGTTQDPATPYQWSVSLAERIGATLLTYDGEGHTAYGRSNQCIVDAVDGFLVDGVMPAAGIVC